MSSRRNSDALLLKMRLSCLSRVGARPARLLLQPRWRSSSGEGGTGGEAGGNKRGNLGDRNKSVLYGLGAVVITAVGLSYAAVPLYRMFCSVTGYGGTTGKDEAGTGFNKQAKNEARPIRVRFNTDVSASLPWSFRPLQQEVTVVPGVTSLAFFRAKVRAMCLCFQMVVSLSVSLAHTCVRRTTATTPSWASARTMCNPARPARTLSRFSASASKSNGWRRTKKVRVVVRASGAFARLLL